MSEHVQCITLGPLYMTYAKMFLVDINRLEFIAGSKNLFVNNKGHPLSKVEIFALVTETCEKEQLFRFTLEDGTSSIKSIWWKNDPENEGIKNCIEIINQNILKSPGSNVGIALKQKLKNIAHLHPGLHVKIGDFVCVQGKLQMNKYDDTLEVSIHKLSCIKENSLDVWLDWIKYTKTVYENIYNKPFGHSQDDSELTQAFSQGLETLLTDKLKFIFTQQSDIKQFYGYEILELPEIKSELQEFVSTTDVCSPSKLSKKKENHETTLTSKEIRDLSIQCIIKGLKIYVANGKLIKQKCDQHEKLTNIPELDAFYLITEKMKELKASIKSSNIEIKNPNVVKEFKKIIEKSNYEFIKNSRFIFEILTVLTSDNQ